MTVGYRFHEKLVLDVWVSVLKTWCMTTNSVSISLPYPATTFTFRWSVVRDECVRQLNRLYLGSGHAGFIR